MNELTIILLDAGLKGAVVLALAGAVVVCLRRVSAATRHLVWTLAIVGVLALPVLSAVLPGWQILPALPQREPVQATETEKDASAPERDDAQRAQREAAPEAHKTEPSVATQRTPRAQQKQSISAPSHTPAPRAPAESSPQPTQAESTERAASPAIEHEQAQQQAPSADDGASWWLSMLYWLPAVWLAGFVIALLPVKLGALSLWRLARAGRLVEDSWLLALLEKAQAQMQLRRTVKLMESPRREMPLTWGILRLRILLPAEAHTWPADRLRAVMLHELAHIKRHDCLTQLLTRIACALYWYNPLVWLAARRMLIERERACDDLVLACGTRGSDYAEHLLTVATGARAQRLAAFAGIAMARKSGVEGRLLAILDPKRNRTTLGRLGITGAVAALLAILIPVACVTVAEQDAAQRVTEEKESAEAEAADWSQTMNGMQVRMVAPQGTTWDGASALPLRVEVRNVSDEPLPLSRIVSRPSFRFRIGEDAQWQWLRHGRTIQVTPWADRDGALAPGATVAWTLQVSDLHPRATWPAGSDVQVQVSPTQHHVEGQLPVNLHSPPLQFHFAKDFPQSLQRADLPETWHESLDLTLRTEAGVWGGDTLHINGDGQATLLLGHQKNDRPRGRYQVTLDREKLDALVRLLREQKVWQLDDESPRHMPAPDALNVQIALRAGQTSLVTTPTEPRHGPPALQAIYDAMQSLIDDALARARDDEREDEPSGDGNAAATQPAARSTSFTRPGKTVIHDLDEAPGHHFLDLDNGQRITLNDRPTDQALAAWLNERGADLGVEFAEGGVSLVSVGLVLNHISAEEWDTLKPDAFPEHLKGDDPGDEVIERDGLRYHRYDGRPTLPLTFAFQTRDGAQGIIQITGFTDNPKGAKLRYKLVTAEQGGNAAETEATVGGLRVRLVSEQDKWLPGQTPSVQFEVLNVSDEPVRIVPIKHEGVLAGLKLRVRRPGEADSELPVDAGPKHVDWQWPEPVELMPGRTMQVSKAITPSPRNAAFGEPWEVRAAFSSEHGPAEDDADVWRGTIEVSTPIRFHDLQELSTQRLIGFLGTDHEASGTLYIARELARRAGLQDAPSFRDARRSSDGSYVALYRSANFDGRGLPRSRGEYIALLNDAGEVLWEQDVRFGDAPAVGDAGTVAIPEWLERPSRIRARLIDRDGDTLGAAGPEPTKKFRDYWQREQFIRPAFAPISAMAFSPGDERLYFVALGSDWQPDQLYAVRRNGDVLWQVALDEPLDEVSFNLLRVSPDGRYVLAAEVLTAPSGGFAVFNDRGERILFVEQLNNHLLGKTQFSFEGDQLIVRDADGVRVFDFTEDNQPEDAPDAQQPHGADATNEPRTNDADDNFAHIHGRVLETPDGAPVAGREVGLRRRSDGKAYTTTTNDDGRYRFEGVAPGRYTVRVLDRSAGVWREGIDVTVEQEPTRAPPLHLRLPHRVAGTVTDAQGEPVSGAELTVRTWRPDGSVNTESLETDAQGRYRLYVTPGKVAVRCHGTQDRYYPIEPAPNYGRSERMLDVAAAQHIERADFTVRSAPPFSGTVLQPDGTGAANASVVLSVKWSRMSEAEVRRVEAARQRWPERSLEEPAEKRHEARPPGGGRLYGPSYARTFELTTDAQGRFHGHLRRPSSPPPVDEAIDIIAAARSDDLSLAGRGSAQSTTLHRYDDLLTIRLEPAASARINAVNPDGEPVADVRFTTNSMELLERGSASWPVPTIEPVYEQLKDGSYRANGLIPNWPLMISNAEAPGYRDLFSPSLRFSAQPGEQIDAGTLRLHRWDARLVPTLVDRMGDADNDEREHALFLLRRLVSEDAEALQALRAVARDHDDEPMRHAAQRALRQMGQGAPATQPAPANP